MSEKKKLQFCGICDGKLVDGRALIFRTSLIDRSPVLIEVPAQVCEKCGHRWYTHETILLVEAAQRGEVAPTKSMTVPVVVAASA